jgi:DNA mismatch repair protein MutS2
VNIASTEERSQRDLEWHEVQAAVAESTRSDLGRQLALNLSPASDQETAETRHAVMAEVLQLGSVGFPLPAGFIRDCRRTAETLERSGTVSASELSALAQLLRVALELDRFGEHHADSAPLLARMLQVEAEISSLLRRLNETVDEEGHVLDTASPGLANLRSEVRQLRARMKKRLEEVMARYREALQDGYFAEREGRYVLPVRADAPFRVEGIVLDTSGSGSTLYVEPKELAELGNKIRLKEGEVEREIALILADVSAQLSPFAEEILWAQEVCARADLLQAIGQFSSRVGAVVVPFDEPGCMHLRAARHPLLCLQAIAVVPNDLTVSAGRALVLSGPNAGGKTVALKTLGLLALMQASGLPVPAHAESRIGFFHEVLCDIGDDQSISMSLSSFSGHVERVREILDEAGHGTLVLFDELMSGTDPDEGAVLAIATVDELVSTGAAICVTTHYEPLKEHAGSCSHLENGAVGFDFEKMGPTFRVEMGRPGASSAIIVAERHGLPSRIVRRAVELLPDVSAHKRDQALQLEEKSLSLDKERRALVEARAEQDALNRRLSLELEKLREQRRKALVEESDALQNEVKQARAELRSLRQAFKSVEASQLRQMDEAIDRASSVVAVGSAVDRTRRAQAVQDAPLAPELVQLGARVRIRGFDTEAEVIELPKKGNVRVLIGVMKMSVPLGEILPKTTNASRDMAPPQRTKTSFEASTGAEPALLRTEDVTLDLRGERVEPGLDRLDQFVDDLLRRSELGGFVLHGHGTGAMKEAVRAHLRAHACIGRSRPAERDEGGDAFTLFWFQGV